MIVHRPLVYGACITILILTSGWLWISANFDQTTPVVQTHKSTHVEGISQSLVEVPPTQIITSLLTSWYLHRNQGARLPWRIADREPWLVMPTITHVHDITYSGEYSSSSSNPYVDARWNTFFHRFISRVAPRYLPPQHWRQSRKLDITSTCTAIQLSIAPWCLHESEIAFAIKDDPQATLQKAIMLYNGSAPLHDIKWTRWDGQQHLQMHQEGERVEGKIPLTVVTALRRAALAPSMARYHPGIHVCIGGDINYLQQNAQNLLDHLLIPIAAHRTHLATLVKSNISAFLDEGSTFITKASVANAISSLLAVQDLDRVIPMGCDVCERIYLRYVLRLGLHKDASVGIPVHWIFMTITKHYYLAPIELTSASIRCATLTVKSDLNVTVSADYRGPSHHQRGILNRLNISQYHLVSDIHANTIFDYSRVSDRILFASGHVMQHILTQLEYIVDYSPHWAVPRNVDSHGEILLGRYVMRFLRPLMLLSHNRASSSGGAIPLPLSLMLCDFRLSDVQAPTVVASCVAYRFVPVGNRTLTLDDRHGSLGRLSIQRVDPANCHSNIMLIRQQKGLQFITDRMGFCLADADVLSNPSSIRVYYSWTPPFLGPDGRLQLFDPNNR